MKIDVDLNDNLYDEACLLMARDGEEINRTQLTVELMRLLGSCIEQAGQCPPPLLFAIEELTAEPDAHTGDDES
jgi:hypothetical protein